MRIGGEGGCDYLTVDSSIHRLYVAANVHWAHGHDAARYLHGFQIQSEPRGLLIGGFAIPMALIALLA